MAAVSSHGSLALEETLSNFPKEPARRGGRRGSAATRPLLSSPRGFCFAFLQPLFPAANGLTPQITVAALSPPISENLAPWKRRDCINNRGRDIFTATRVREDRGM